MNKIISMLALLVFISNVYPAFEILNSPAAGYWGGSRGPVNSFLLNPALIKFQINPNISLSYQQPFKLKNLNHSQMTSHIKIKEFNAGVCFSLLGNKIYNESKIAVNFGRAFINNKFFLAVSANFFSISAQKYNGAKTWSVDIGTLYKLSDKIQTGYSVRAINRPKINGYENEMPIANCISVLSNPTEHFGLDVSIIKEDRYPICIIFCSHLVLNDRVELLSTFMTDPATPIIGFNLNLLQVQLNYTLRYHFDLGESHYWSIVFFRK